MSGVTPPYQYAGLVRVDDRLVHGQVLVNWVRALGLTRLVVVDDTLAVDAVTRAVIRAVVPEQVALWVGPVSTAYQALVGFGESIEKHLVLVANPRLALDLYSTGIHYLELNIGCLGSDPGRRRLLRQVSLSPVEYGMLSTLAMQGVEIISQAIPTDAVVRWSEIRSRAERALFRQVETQ